MLTAARTAVSLVAGLVLLPGCAALELAVSDPEQSVTEACAVFDNHEFLAEAAALKKVKSGSPKAALKTMDAFATTFEATIEKVKNPDVKVQAQLASIALRNFTAEIRAYQPTHAHQESLKADLETLEKRFNKLDELCTA